MFVVRSLFFDAGNFKSSWVIFLCFDSSHIFVGLFLFWYIFYIIFFHTAGRIVSPSGTLTIFIIQKFLFCIDCLNFFHCLFELFLILFLYGLMNIYCAWVQGCFESNQCTRLYLRMFWEHGFKAENLFFYVAASSCFTFILHNFHTVTYSRSE